MLFVSLVAHNLKPHPVPAEGAAGSALLVGEKTLRARGAAKGGVQHLSQHHLNVMSQFKLNIVTLLQASILERAEGLAGVSM